jgi:hypothetical protein
MMKKIIFPIVVITLLFVVVAPGSCKNEEKAAIERMKDIEMVTASIHGVIGWAAEKDFGLLYSIIANDSNYLEVGPSEGLIHGFDEFKRCEAIWGSADFKAISYEIRNLTVSLSKGGDTAWFYCILDDINEWKGRPACWINARWTGVLEKRDGRWVIVQQHFSLPV